MLPDVLGYNIDDGLEILKKSGVSSLDIEISKYTSPKRDIIGDDVRIVSVSSRYGKIILVVSNF